MACKSCATGGCGSIKGKPAGCKSNGGCSSGGCNKMNVFDWLSNMETPGLSIPGTSRFDTVEVKFKGGRKEYYRNVNNLELHTGDPVVVEMQNGGYHLGYVSLQGELVRLQMLKKKVPTNEVRTIYRIGTDKDVDKHEQAVARELPTMYRAREIVGEFSLNMKLSDVEYQADNAKAVFYYSSEERVDFRELIKRLAGEFKIRVEMKQISLRQEAGRLGGLGVCGRELCCSTWLTDFRNVTTSAARYQNLSLNPIKLSGQCGRLKCCLNYELETYMDALKDIPNLERPLQTQQGDAFLQKTDIFRRLMWFSFKGHEFWLPVPIDRVKEVIELNKKGDVPISFEQLALTVEEPAGPTVINSDLERMDKKYRDRTPRDTPNHKFKSKKKGGPDKPGQPGPERANGKSGGPQPDGRKK